MAHAPGAYLSNGGCAVADLRQPTARNQKSLGAAAAAASPCHSLAGGSGARATLGGAPALIDLSRTSKTASTAV